MPELTAIFSVALALFILIDPIGNVPIFISILKELPARRQRGIIFRELLIALAIIIIFFFIGDFILDLLQVTQDTVKVAGGIILFLIALKMIFPTSRDASLELGREKEPFIVPLATPLVAGPAVLAAVMIYSHREEMTDFIMIMGIVIAWVASTLILVISPWLKNILGWRGLMACERLMGLILTLIAVQMFLAGIASCLCPNVRV